MEQAKAERARTRVRAHYILRGAITEERQVQHAERVAALVLLYGAHEDQVSAALLHDVIEDSPLTAAHLRAMRIPAHVVDMVVLLTNTETGNRRERKAAMVKRLADAPRPVRLIKLCDRLDNLRRMDRKPGATPAFLRLYAEESERLIRAIGHDLPPRLYKRALGEADKLARSARDG